MSCDIKGCTHREQRVPALGANSLPASASNNYFRVYTPRAQFVLAYIMLAQFMLAQII